MNVLGRPAHLHPHCQCACRLVHLGTEGLCRFYEPVASVPPRASESDLPRVVCAPCAAERGELLLPFAEGD